jgi:hypothetical protein
LTKSRDRRGVKIPKDPENGPSFRFYDKAGQTRFSTKLNWGVNFELYFGLQ